MAIEVAVPSTEKISFSEIDAKMAKLWALDKGYPVPSRGRVSGDIMLAWHFDGRNHYEVPEKFTIPRDEKKLFTAWALANGHDTDAKGYAAWESAGKVEPEGYMSDDTLAVIDYVSAATGEIEQVPVLKERMDVVRGTGRGRPASRDYLTAAGLPEGAEPKRLVTRNGAVHRIEQDEESGDYVIRWETKRDGADQYREQITQARAENDRLSARINELESVVADYEAVNTDQAATIERMTARIAELEAAAKPAPRKRATGTGTPARKPRARKTAATAAE